MFIVLGALLSSPLIPGAILQSFPLTSQSFTTGEQSLACINALTNIKSSVAYNAKNGSPITWDSSTTTTQTALCNGSAQSAVVEHTSQFNPLGLLIDIALALVLAIIIAKVWRIVYTRRHRKR
jgi:hypothetical protein